MDDTTANFIQMMLKERRRLIDNNSTFSNMERDFYLEIQELKEQHAEEVDAIKTELGEYKRMLANPATMLDSVLFELCNKYCEAYKSEDFDDKDSAAKRIDEYIIQLRGFDYEM